MLWLRVRAAAPACQGSGTRCTAPRCAAGAGRCCGGGVASAPRRSAAGLWHALVVQVSQSYWHWLEVDAQADQACVIAVRAELGNAHGVLLLRLTLRPCTLSPSPPPPPWLDHQPEPLRLGGPQAQGHRADAGRGRDRRGAGGGARRLAGGRAGARCCCCGGGAGCLLGVVVMVVLTRCHRLCRPAVWDGQRGRRRGSATRLMCGRQAPPARLQPSLRLPPRCVVVLDLAC